MTEYIRLLHDRLATQFQISGVSNEERPGEPGSRVIWFVDEPDSAELTLAYDIADNFDRLVVTPVETVIPVSTASVPSTVTITVSDLTDFDYVVFERQGSEWVQVADGTINDGTLEFESFDDGRFLIEVRDGFLTGYSEIEVTA